MGSVWEDIRDTVTAPARAVVDAATAPIRDVIKVAQGQNLGQIFSEHAASLFKDTSQALTAGPLHFFGTDSGQAFLRSSTVSKISLGISDNYAGFSTLNKNIGDLQAPTHETLLEAGRFGLTLAAATGGAAAVAGISAGTAVTGYGVAQAVSKGDWSAAASAAAGAAGIDVPQEAKDVYHEAASAVMGPPAPVDPTPRISNPYPSVDGGYASNVVKAGPSLAMILAVGAIGLYAFRGGKRG